MTPRVTIVAARMYIQPLEWKGQLKRREPRTTASTCLITYLRREAVYGSQWCVVPDHGASRGVYTNPSLSSLRITHVKLNLLYSTHPTVTH